MKRFLVLFFFLLFLPSFTFAQTINKKEVVILSKDTTVNENYFAYGEAITVLGTINGDAYIAGGNVLMNGTINGDLLVTGGSVNIDGIVAGDVRAAGGTVHVTGNIDGNITVVGGNVTITKDALVGKGLVAGAGQISIFAPIKGGVTVGAGSALFANEVGGNVIVSAGQLTLSPTASLQGNLTYYSDNIALIQPGTTILGKVNYRKIPIEKDEIKRKSKEVHSLIKGFSFAFKVYTALVGFIIGVILSLLFPRYLKKATDIIQEQSLLTAGVGLVILIGLPIVLVLLAFTIIGIPITIIGFAIYFIYIYLAKIFVALFIGKKLSDRLNWPDSYLLHLTLGFVTWVILTSIPYVGWLAQLAVVVMGLGAIALTKKYYLQTLRSKKLI